MKYLLYTFILISCCSIAYAQEKSPEMEVKAVIQTMFDGMRAGDSSMVASAFLRNAPMQTTFYDKNGDMQLKDGTLDRFLNAVGTPHDEVWDEKIWSYDIRVDEPLATAWTDYTFYLGDKQLHCGTNAFDLVKTKDGWKISQIIDTRRKENCTTEADAAEKALGTMIDGWHKAAAVADEDAFFGAMTKDGIYIGTDPSERWLRDELREWAGFAFERESAWDFKVKERQIYMEDDRKMAWWDETLDTWMGICRGSGVAILTQDGWKIKHYHLSVTVLNDKIEEFKKINKE
jgi:hypothetical protein